MRIDPGMCKCTWPHCRLDHRNLECPQWSRRYGFPPHQARVLTKQLECHCAKFGVLSVVRTNGVGLDFDSILNVGPSRVIRFLVSEDALAAKGVDEGSSACKDASIW